MTLEAMLSASVVYLAAAVVAVPLAARLGLGSVLGYLIAGVAIGPYALGLVGAEAGEVMHFAELGVVMMLFLVGLELDPARLWRMRVPVFGYGGAQVVGTAALVAGVAGGAGLPWQQAVAVGLIAAMSSTAIALQTLQERGWARGEAGQSAFAVLLFQDVAVIPILALMPALATLEVHGGGDGHGGGWLAELAGWQQGLLMFGAVIGVVGVGRLLVGPLMRAVAKTGIRELFTSVALLLVLGVAQLMAAVGLSAALGTFVAGVVLANSEYRHELESDVEPFKGLLLGLFFIAVGASIDFGVLAQAPLLVSGGLVGVMALKALVLAGIGRFVGLGAEQTSLFACALPQVGEFAFVLLSFAGGHGVLPESVTAPMVAITAFSMALTPFLFTAHGRWLAPWLRGVTAPTSTREQAVHDEHPQVIVAGYGRFGQIVGRLLRAHGVPVTVLELDVEQVDMLARFGHRAFYGDAARLDLLRSAGAASAKVLVVAVDAPETVSAIVHLAKRHFPQLRVLARARGRTEAYTLREEGADGVYRETFDTAVRLGADVIHALGTPAHAAHRAAARFRHHDELALRELGEHRHDEAFVSRIRARMADVEAVLRADFEGGPAQGEGTLWSEVERRADARDEGRAAEGRD